MKLKMFITSLVIAVGVFFGGGFANAESYTNWDSVKQQYPNYVIVKKVNQETVYIFAGDNISSVIIKDGRVTVRGGSNHVYGFVNQKPGSSNPIVISPFPAAPFQFSEPLEIISHTVYAEIDDENFTVPIPKTPVIIALEDLPKTLQKQMVDGGILLVALTVFGSLLVVGLVVRLVRLFSR